MPVNQLLKRHDFDDCRFRYCWTFGYMCRVWCVHSAAQVSWKMVQVLLFLVQALYLFDAGVMINGAGLFFFGAGVRSNGAGAILGGGPAPMERVEWRFVAQVWAIKTHLHQM